MTEIKWSIWYDNMKQNILNYYIGGTNVIRENTNGRNNGFIQNQGRTKKRKN